MENLKKMATIVNANAFIINLSSKKITRLTQSNTKNESLINTLVTNLNLINHNLYQSLNYNDGHLITCCIEHTLVICFAFDYSNLCSENSELMIVNSLTNIQSVAQILYTLYTKRDAPKTPVVITHIQPNLEYITVFEKKDDPEKLFNLETIIVDAIINSEKEKIKKTLDELSHVQLIKQQVSNNLLRSEKYTLVGYLAILNHAIIYWGYPVQLATKIHNESIKEVELTHYIPDFFQFICEITWHYFKIIQEYRVHNFLPLAERIHQYIKEHISENITLNNIAEGLTESKNNLNPAFKAEYDSTIKQFIKKSKIDTSKELLLTSSFSIAEISDILSYTNASYFVKTFKEITGMTPAFFRKNFFNKQMSL